MNKSDSQASQLAIGLLIVDGSESRLCMMALMCRKTPSPMRLSSLVQLPKAGATALHDLDSARMKRSLEPLVGEVFDFAQTLSGGIAIRHNEMSSDVVAPSIVVTKRVTKDQWEIALVRSQAWISDCKKVFPSIIEHIAVHQSPLSSNPSGWLDPELEQFKIFALSLARGMHMINDLATPKIEPKVNEVKFATKYRSVR